MVVAVYLLTTTIAVSFGAGGMTCWMTRPGFPTRNLYASTWGGALAILVILFAVGAWTAKAAIFLAIDDRMPEHCSFAGLGTHPCVIGILSKPLLGFITVYGLLFIATPQMMLVLASAGVLDGLIDFRKRFLKSEM